MDTDPVRKASPLPTTACRYGGRVNAGYMVNRNIAIGEVAALGLCRHGSNIPEEQCEYNTKLLERA